MKYFLSFCLIAFFTLTLCIKSFSQAKLSADGPGNTYELINSIFAPNYVAVESPDQCSSHPAFGRHIAEVWDSVLNKYVFEFYIHIPTSFPVTINTSDNDRCLNFDRQRIEIKTYDQSPDSLKGTIGETITYKWKFKIPTGFQPSSAFTHIHQIKAVGGDESEPLFTLTARKASPNRLELIYVADSNASNNRVATVNLSSLENVWVEATETIKVGSAGSYTMTIKRVSDGANLLSYSNSNISTIRPSNTFIRPKWGIYRSLNSAADLRDESIRLADFSIAEILPSISISKSNGVVCNGSIVTFTAIGNNTGNTPIYQWKKNSINVGSNSTTYTANNFVSGDIIACILTSSDPNALPTTATSNSIVLAVKAGSSSTTNISICPSLLPYLWNGLTFATFGSKIAYLTNSVGCDSAATLNLVASQALTPSVSISTATTSVCSGSNTAFTATATNGGTSPNYQWKKNGVDVGSGSSITFPSGSLSNNDVITCTLTANNVCQTSATANSNAIQLTVKQSPSVAPINNGTSNVTTASLCTLGAITKYFDATPYGTWSSSNPTVASVTGGSQSGSVTANTNGTAMISYNVAANGCVSTASVAVTVAAITPNVITGNNSICVGTTTALSCTAPAGTTGVWSSSNDRGSINSSGVYTGLNAGNYGEAKYTVADNTTGCKAFSSRTITVNPTPVVPTITYAPGTTSNPQAGAPTGSFCVGKTFSVVATPNVPAGVWSATGAASVTSGGVVTINAVGAGSIKYTYTSAAGCVNSRTMSGNGYTCASRGVTINEKQAITK